MSVTRNPEPCTKASQTSIERCVPDVALMMVTSTPRRANAFAMASTWIPCPENAGRKRWMTIATRSASVMSTPRPTTSRTYNDAHMLDFVRTALWPRIPTLRIASANRLSLDRLLLRQFERLDAGCVLDVGAKGSPYTRVIPATQYMRLDIDPASDPDICCDINATLRN